MGRDDDRDRHREQLAGWADEELALFTVVGLRRRRGGSGSAIGFLRAGGHQVSAVMSQSVPCMDDDGGSIVITSHRRRTSDGYETTRAWAPINPYLSTPEGRAAAARWDRSGPPPAPPNLNWGQASIAVDGQDTAFEVCDVGGGWVGVGEVPEAIITIDSRGVPLPSVRLARLTDPGYPPPPPPDLGPKTGDAIRSLDERFDRLPVRRVRRYADYWALRDIEAEHARKLATRIQLTPAQSDALGRYWLERLECHLAGKLDHWDQIRMATRHHSRLAQRLGTGVIFQLWSNTIGPGGRTWFGNRYASIRPYTFRIRWRP